MAIRRIRLLGDPILRQISSPCLEPGPILEDLRDTLHEFQRAHGFGRGISAVQIGVPERLIYIEFESREYCLVNPAWESMSEGTFELWDDCFSFPDLLVYVVRHTSVKVGYADERGELQTLEAAGALSELLQHEMDHLDGRLAIDLAMDDNSLCLREEWQRRYGD